MTLLHPAESKQAWAARLMVEAMQRDVDNQRELVGTRSRGETGAVYREKLGGSDQMGRFSNQVQCTMIRIYLASESIRAEIERSRALLGLNQSSKQNSSCTNTLPRKSAVC